MIKLASLTALALALVIVVSSTLHAQTLQEGTWTGTAVDPDGASNDVTFEVSRPLVWAPDGSRLVLTGAPLSIAYHSAEGSNRLKNIQLDDDTLTYDFTVGELEATCSLARQEDGSYTGSCSAGGTQMGQHTMHPPTG